MGKKNCFDIERFKKGPSVIKTCLHVTDEPSYKRVSFGLLRRCFGPNVVLIGCVEGAGETIQYGGNERRGVR